MAPLLTHPCGEANEQIVGLCLDWEVTCWDDGSDDLQVLYAQVTFDCDPTSDTPGAVLNREYIDPETLTVVTPAANGWTAAPCSEFMTLDVECKRMCDRLVVSPGDLDTITLTRFWQVTVYDGSGAVVVGPIARDALGNPYTVVGTAVDCPEITRSETILCELDADGVRVGQFKRITYNEAATGHIVQNQFGSAFHDVDLFDPTVAYVSAGGTISTDCGAPDPECELQLLTRVTGLLPEGVKVSRWDFGSAAVGAPNGVAGLPADTFTLLDAKGLPAHVNAPDSVTQETITTQISDNCGVTDQDSQMLAEFWVSSNVSFLIRNQASTAQSEQVFIESQCNGSIKELGVNPYAGDPTLFYEVPAGVYKFYWYVQDHTQCSGIRIATSVDGGTVWSIPGTAASVPRFFGDDVVTKSCAPVWVCQDETVQDLAGNDLLPLDPAVDFWCDPLCLDLTELPDAESYAMVARIDCYDTDADGLPDESYYVVTTSVNGVLTDSASYTLDSVAANSLDPDLWVAGTPGATDVLVPCDPDVEVLKNFACDTDGVYTEIRTTVVNGVQTLTYFAPGTETPIVPTFPFLLDCVPCDQFEIIDAWQEVSGAANEVTGYLWATGGNAAPHDSTDVVFPNPADPFEHVSGQPADFTNTFTDWSNSDNGIDPAGSGLDQSIWEAWIVTDVPIILRDTNTNNGEYIGLYIQECCGPWEFKGQRDVQTGAQPAGFGTDIPLPSGIHRVLWQLSDSGAQSGIAMEYSEDGGNTFSLFPIEQTYSSKPDFECVKVRVCEDGSGAFDVITGLPVVLADLHLCQPGICGSLPKHPINVAVCTPGEAGANITDWSDGGGAIDPGVITADLVFTGTDSDGLPAHPNPPDTTGVLPAFNITEFVNTAANQYVVEGYVRIPRGETRRFRASGGGAESMMVAFGSCPSDAEIVFTSAANASNAPTVQFAEVAHSDGCEMAWFRIYVHDDASLSSAILQWSLDGVAWATVPAENTFQGKGSCATEVRWITEDSPIVLAEGEFIGECCCDGGEAGSSTPDQVTLASGGESFAGTAVVTPPVSPVRSLTLTKESGGAVSVSFDSGATFNLVVNRNGSRTWGQGEGDLLDVSAMRFQGANANSDFDLIWEV